MRTAFHRCSAEYIEQCYLIAPWLKFLFTQKGIPNQYSCAILWPFHSYMWISSSPMLKYMLIRDRDLLECFWTVLNSSILGNADLYIYLLTKLKHNSKSCQKHYKIFSYSNWFTATLLTFMRQFKAWIWETRCNKCSVKVADLVMRIPSWLITSES